MDYMPHTTRFDPAEDAHVACGRKADTVGHSLVCALALAAAPAFFTRLGNDGFGIADIFGRGTHLSPSSRAAQHCRLECGGRKFVQISHVFLPVSVPMNARGHGPRG